MFDDEFKSEVERVKAQYTMREIVERYGFHVSRSGYIPCPFHNGDNSPSLKVYKDSYYCFGCGASGDIFTFIQKMDGLSFKDALVSLGGEIPDKRQLNREDRDRITRNWQQRIQNERNKKIIRERKWQQIENHENTMDRLKKAMNELEPFSDEWSRLMNEYMDAYIKRDILFEEVNSLSDRPG